MTNAPIVELPARRIAESLERIEAAEMPDPLIAVVSGPDFPVPAQFYDVTRRRRRLDARGPLVRDDKRN